MVTNHKRVKFVFSPRGHSTITSAAEMGEGGVKIVTNGDKGGGQEKVTSPLTPVSTPR